MKKRKAAKTQKANLCGKQVKLARAMREMHQVDLAAALAVDCGLERMNQSMISAIERSARQVSDIELSALSQVLEVTVEWLMYGDKKSGKKS